jgi:hypothetical protein
VRGREIISTDPRDSRDKLTNVYFDSKLGTTSTVRNWRTVVKLLRVPPAPPPEVDWRSSEGVSEMQKSKLVKIGVAAAMAALIAAAWAQNGEPAVRPVETQVG